MSIDWDVVTEAPLYEEHMLLGGLFAGEEAMLAAPLRYGTVKDEHLAHTHGCGLTDLSGMSLVLLSGDEAESFASAACANELLSVGDSSFGAVVTGDGQVAAVPLVSRTGDHEYLLCDLTERGLGLVPWLGFLSSIEQGGYRPFDTVSVEDVSADLHPLLLWGPSAPAVLGDYVASVADLPAPGTIVQLTLDNTIHVLAIGVPLEGEPCYLLLVPTTRARVLWRSLLSFASVSPVGTNALAQAGRSSARWMQALLDEERLAYELLVSWGLVRESADYVGARALANMERK